MDGPMLLRKARTGQTVDPEEEFSSEAHEGASSHAQRRRLNTDIC